MRSFCLGLLGTFLAAILSGCGGTEEGTVSATEEQTANAAKLDEMKGQMLKGMKIKGVKGAAKRSG